MSIQNDSKVLLSNQNTYTFSQLISLSNINKTLIGYGVTKAGQVVETVLTTPRFVTREEVLQIQLSTGEFIECTKDTQFYLELNQSIFAQDLKVSDRPLVQISGDIEITAITVVAGLKSTYTLTSSKLGNYILACGLLIKSN